MDDSKIHTNGITNDTKDTQEDTKPSINPPNINLLHEDVKIYIENYVKQQGYKNVDIKVEIGSNLGDNFLGFIGKLLITCIDTNNQIKTFNWIVKTAPNLEMYRSMMNVEKVYEREAHVYETIFKIFDEFQLEKNVLNPFNEHPEFILSYLKYEKESIVMKDMKHIGYVMRPRQEPLDLNHVRLVMKAYAKLHAISYVLKDQKPEVFKNLTETTRDIVSEIMMSDEQIKNQMPLMELAIGALDPVKDEKVLLGYQKFLDNYSKVLTDLLTDTNEKSVIGHGDSWVNNTLWKYNDLNIPINVCLLDWQLARFGSPACDLSYFIFACTTKEFRDEHYDNMIKLYYYTLCAHMIEMGSDPQKYLSFEDLEGELKKYSLVGLFTAVMVISIMTKDAEEIPEWREGDFSQEVEEMFLKKGKHADKYNERVRGVLVDYYEKGYFDYLM